METVTTVPLEMEFLRATSLHLFLLHLQGGNDFGVTGILDFFP